MKGHTDTHGPWVTNLYLSSMAEAGRVPAAVSFIFPERGWGLLLGPDRSMLTTTLPRSLWKHVGRRKQEGGGLSWMLTAWQLIKRSSQKAFMWIQRTMFPLLLLASNCKCKFVIGFDAVAPTILGASICYTIMQLNDRFQNTSVDHLLRISQLSVFYCKDGYNSC